MQSTSGSAPTQPVREEISYPATRMMSIAELLEPIHTRSFKTPAERKEMPPLPVDYSLCSADRSATTTTTTTTSAPAQYDYGNTSFTSSDVTYHSMSNIPPRYFDLQYYTGAPLAYRPLPPLDNYHAPPQIPTYTPPPINPNLSVVKDVVFSPPYPVSDVPKSSAKKEKKRRSATSTTTTSTITKRPEKFHPYAPRYEQ